MNARALPAAGAPWITSGPFAAGHGPARGTLARYDLGDGEGLDVEVLGLAGDGETDLNGVEAPDETSTGEAHYWLRGEGFGAFLGAASELTY
ncbi:hypothetical protein CcI49_02975 [Frankia sp. CcI49]|uniref:hypothetical protein n=1 Tax=Frankia sp. CcI49 TaxID=1745382 RepID=UPI000978726C|nr:hypothetical protein [Frankia sp. CcI49]ONH62358.1 hypothetical protein CcI49_02975 [Frankia sp. CcI49]